MAVGKRYTVSDGELTLVLEVAEEGGFVVTCPANPAVTTQAETVPEAFDMARDALQILAALNPTAEG
jgi:antitoxin HicB